MNVKNKDEISLKWLFKQSSPDRWNLNHADLANLLGINEVSARKIEEDLALGLPIELTENTKIRLSKLLSIYKGIYEISPHGQENSFFTNPNSGDFLNGLSIKIFLLKTPTTDTMRKIISWLKYI